MAGGKIPGHGRGFAKLNHEGKGSGFNLLSQVLFRGDGIGGAARGTC